MSLSSFWRLGGQAQFVLLAVLFVLLPLVTVDSILTGALSGNAIYPWSVTTTLGAKAIIDSVLLLVLLTLNEHRWSICTSWLHTLVGPRNLKNLLSWYEPHARVKRWGQWLVWYAIFATEVCVAYAVYFTSERHATARNLLGVNLVPSADIRHECFVVFSLPVALCAVVNYYAPRMNARQWLMGLVLCGLVSQYLFWYGILSANTYRQDWDKSYITSHFPDEPQTLALTLGSACFADWNRSFHG